MLSDKAAQKEEEPPGGAGFSILSTACAVILAGRYEFTFTKKVKGKAYRTLYADVTTQQAIPLLIGVLITQ